jgi:hypothetical protein
VCVPPVPNGWQGPIAVASGSGTASCPTGYGVQLGDLNAGFRAGATNCSCGCIVNSAVCRLYSEYLGDYFAPVGSCEDAPSPDEDNLYAVVDATCAPQPFVDVQDNSWSTTARSCGTAAASTVACTRGACYDNASGFGSVCIAQDGDVACPSDFPARTLYHRSVSDSRACQPCQCALQGDQACEIEIEVCSVGFFQVTLTSGGQPQSLNDSDGDGVTLMSSTVTDIGNCDPVGGTATGAAVPTSPVTVCCL